MNTRDSKAANGNILGLGFHVLHHISYGWSECYMYLSGENVGAVFKCILCIHEVFMVGNV